VLFDLGWNVMDDGWYWQAVELFEVGFVG
jgi:hypothetical protein